MLLADLTEATTTRLCSLDQTHSVRLAADAFGNPRLGLLIACDENQRARGVVSKSDLIRHLASTRSMQVPISEIMTRSIISATPGDDLRGTWQLMVTRRLQNLPLLDAERRPVGMLDIRDALQAMLRLEEAEEDQLVNYIAGIGYR